MKHFQDPESFLKINILKNLTCLVYQFLCKTQSCTLSHMDSQKWRTAPSSEISGGRSGECSDEHQRNKDLQTVRKVFGGTFKSYAVKIKDQIRYEKTKNSTR